MELHADISGEIQESIDVKKQLLAGPAIELIALMARRIAERLKAGNKLIVFGNGGSAADAQHIAAELVGRYRLERKGLAAIALTANTAVLTAVANDYGFEEVFARQVSALGKSGDVVLAISTSGTSPNVLKGLEVARRFGLHTIGLSGQSGGRLVESTELCVCVPSRVTARVQEAHILLGHILCGLIEKLYFADVVAEKGWGSRNGVRDSPSEIYAHAWRNKV
jgi:D-sedoheptulose 7-phosphate isomerase